jgi:putative ABC transport system permease protein
MFKNYIKSALRFLKHNRVFAVINLIGLSIALAVSFLILIYVINELSYDHFNKNRDRVFKVINYYVDLKQKFSDTPYVLATALKKDFPQVEKAVRIKSMRGFKLKLKEEFIPIDGVLATDSEIFDIFTFPLTGGADKKNLLDDKNSIVLTRNLAEKFFPGQNPIGKEIEAIVNNAENILVIRGVFENIPENSSLRANCFVNSRWTVDQINKTIEITDADVNWKQDFWNTWVLISKDCTAKAVENQFRAFEVKYMGEKPQSQYSLQNLGDVYLGSEDIANVRIMGNKKNIRLFSAIAFLIILVASINYIILSTAVSSKRGLEIGIRKTFGSINRNIKNQLLSESVLLAMIVLPVALILMKIALPFAGRLFQTQLNLIGSNIVIYIIVYLVLTITIGLVSGLYTSFYLSQLKVIDILKNTLPSSNRKKYFRSFLIVVQLIVFCTFVSSTLIIRSQYNYAIHKDPGYYNKNILFINLGRDFKGYSAFINNIKSNPNIIMAAGSMDNLPLEGGMIMMFPNQQDKTVMVKVEGFAVDYDYMKTLGITLLQGREFSPDFGSDLKQSVLLNETAIKQLGLTDPLGKLAGNISIIGVVKDFNLHTIHSDIPPLLISMTDLYIMQVAVHYKPGSLKLILPMLEAEWKKAAPDRTFQYTTIEDLSRELYSSERNLSTIVLIFSIFTLIIAALGLFGLTLFLARSRMKEIGIRKVYGSSEQSIVYSFLLNNLMIVIVAALISIPVTIHFMTKWLSTFAYKTNINWWIFVVSFAAAATVVLLTVYINSYKASHINPVDAFRYE